MRLKRVKEFNDSFRSYQIYVNDNYVCSIGSGQIVDIPNVSIDQEVYAKIDWCRSNKVRISDNTEELIVKSNISKYTILVFLVMVLTSLLLFFMFNMKIFMLTMLLPVLYMFYRVTIDRSNYLHIEAK